MANRSVPVKMGSAAHYTHDSASGKSLGKGWQLVALPVSCHGCASCCISVDDRDQPKEESSRYRNAPERSIESTGKLGRITHQTTSIRIAFFNKPKLDRLDTPIHHITRRNDVRTGLCIRQRDICNTIGRSRHVEMRRSVEEVGNGRVLGMRGGRRVR